MLTLPRTTQKTPAPIGPSLPPPSIEQAIAQLPLDSSYIALPAPSFAQLQAPALTWLWQGHIPCGSITLLDGPASCGKTRFLLDLAARVSSGQPMPDATPGLHAPVILITPNDPASILSHPSLVLANADLHNIFSFNFVHNSSTPPESDQPASSSLSSSQSSQPSPTEPSTHPFRFDPTDLDTLAHEITRTHAKLLIIDPLVATLDALPSTSERIIARLLNQLQLLVANLDIACILVRQCDPRQRSPRLTRAEKSPHLLTKSLTSFAILPDPLAPDNALLIHTKHTLSIVSPTQQFQLIPHPDNPAFPQLLWHSTSDLSREDIDSMLAARIPTLMPTRQHILRILQQHPEPISIADLLTSLPFLSYELLRKTLQRMARDLQILNPERGLYTLPTALSQPVVPENVSQPVVPDNVSRCSVPAQLSRQDVPAPVSPSFVPELQSLPSINPIPHIEQISPLSQPVVPQSLSRPPVPEIVPSLPITDVPVLTERNTANISTSSSLSTQNPSPVSPSPVPDSLSLSPVPTNPALSLVDHSSSPTPTPAITQKTKTNASPKKQQKHRGLSKYIQLVH